MVRITKTMQAKHAESLSQWTKDFRNQACSISLPELPKYLSTFPTRWPFPRGDLYHWVSLLNRFDVILEKFCKIYKLDEGPQVLDFRCTVLMSGSGVDGDDAPRASDLVAQRFSQEGDRELVESILRFSRILLQNCGNRSIYASSSHLNSLLHTTSLSLLECTLLLSSELAQRYQAAVKRMPLQSRGVSPALLNNHYNIDLERVTRLALPFSKTVITTPEVVQSTIPGTPSTKGKEKAVSNALTHTPKGPSTVIYANDLVSMVKGGTGVGSSPKSLRNGIDNGSSSRSEAPWDSWGDVKVTYYPKSQPEADATSNTPRAANSSSSALPVTPTPIRRSSNLGPHGQRSGSKQNSSEESPASLPRTPNFPSTDDTPRPNYKVIEIPFSKLKITDIHILLRENLPGLPLESQYELLTNLRVAKALTSSLETRRQILAVRLLAVTNLAYIYAEPAFHENVMKQDSEEPRRLQLVYQLAELVHPPAEGNVGAPKNLQTLAFAALDALHCHQIKLPDICAALNTNVNHGVLLYVVRKAVAEMNRYDSGDCTTADDQWRDALLSLLSSLSMTTRTAGDLVTAGLIPILVEVLQQRTNIAERYYPMVLTFLDTIMYNARDAFQNLVNAQGLDAMSDLIVHQVKSAVENISSGNGTQPAYRSSLVDYEIPFFQQQTLKWLFKFIHHLMSATGHFGSNFDRLLRNLIDSSQLLGSLRQIIGNAHCFGSIVWTNAVTLLNDFINNEPTSFAVIAEAGLSQGFLEAVTGAKIAMPIDNKREKRRTGTEGPSSSTVEGVSTSPPSEDEDSDDEDPTVGHLSPAMLQKPLQRHLAQGILPTSETISVIPASFNAICLNSAGRKMFQRSRALEAFFEIFESPAHVKCMDVNKDLPGSLGQAFDELVRHHPPLKQSIMIAILHMVARVDFLCASRANNEMFCAKLWTVDAVGQPIVASRTNSQVFHDPDSKDKAMDDIEDIEMRDADTESTHCVNPKTSFLSSEINMIPYVTAAVTFLSAIFNNSAIRSDFCSSGGIDYLLNLAQSPCLQYDFWDSTVSMTVHQVIALVAEVKPHLTIPSLLKRASAAADVLDEFAKYEGSDAFFAPFVSTECRSDPLLLPRGTEFVKALVSIHSLVSAIPTCFQPSPYNHRNNSNTFTQINVADHYIRLVRSLGPLLGASVREGTKLRNLVPDHWKDATRSKDTPFSEPPALSSDTPVTEVRDELSIPALSSSTPPIIDTSAGSTNAVSSDQKPKPPTKTEKNSPAFKNYITLRYLLVKLPRIISPFFQTLGKSLMSKRIESFQKQSHIAIADSLAESILAQLRIYGMESSADTYTYWHGIIAVLHEILIETTRQSERPTQTITLVVQAFKDRGGFDRLNHILEVFTNEIQRQTVTEETSLSTSLRLGHATSGAMSLLSLYGQLVNGKNLIDSAQTNALATRADRDRRNSEIFSAHQFLVELRMAILPTIRKMWTSSDLIDKGSSQLCERIIGVLRTIATADFEANAIKRSDKPIAQVKTTHKVFKKNQEHLETLINDGFSDSLSNEALYRCNNNVTLAREYCRELDRVEDPSRRNPIPEEDIDAPSQPSAQLRRRPTESTGTSTPGEDHAMVEESMSRVVDAFIDIETPGHTVQNDGLPHYGHQNSVTSVIPGGDSDDLGTSLVPAAAQTSVAQEFPLTQVTIDDLNEERATLRSNLIDKCLDVINAHGDVTFEIADLITTVVEKSGDPPAQRKVVGDTLVLALMSFAGEEDLGTCGKKIAAYAHLLALFFRDTQSYSAAVGLLKENLETLLMFIKLSPHHTSEEPSPWIAQILLIFEILLSEDSIPQKTKWIPPKDENSTADPPVLETRDPKVSLSSRVQLLEAILDILPRIGKDESLALAVLRILVILTRTRAVAQTMGEKKNIQRLFVMAKQLAGASSRIQSPLMLILRHIIEDDETVKQIMRAEIKIFLDAGRARNVNENNYLRSLAHVALRNPDLFVEVTNEMVKFNRWSYPSSDVPSRNHYLVLKESSDSAPQIPIDVVQPTVQATEVLSIQDVKLSTEATDSEMQDVSKPAVIEQKLPVVENPDGVVHFLLCELMNYRDVEDKDPSTVSGATSEKSNLVTNGDITMSGTSMPPPPPLISKDSKGTKPSSKIEFKAEEHPIYIYRCFILQCLTELLSSYNRTKIEFINFKRSAPPQAMTPSKPRSSVVNYLLFDLIPIGTLDHAETTSLRKKVVTSSWADSVLTALLSKTGEQPLDKNRDSYDSEMEPDLLFVRRFVLENILKAYKEASSSSEPLDVKYSRMVALADLMSHIMHGKENVGMSDTSVAATSQKQLRRIMFDKGYITALTGSIADIDLNFPGAKFAVKYILRPLKTLTTTAISLSGLSLISAAPGQGDEEEIESATSISEPEDQREETPDLFRNSTLGMFEHGGAEDSDSGDEDDDEDIEEGYEYGDEMDYEEEGLVDDEDNISDDDEEIEGIGPIEGLSGDHGVDVEVIMDDEDDEDDSSDEDDDDADSEDDDHRVEIIEELEDVHELGAADDDMGGEWESEGEEDEDDGEEEDYDGQHEEQEEQMAAIDMGPMSHLVRALGDDPAAIEMLGRMAEMEDAGEEDGGERIVGEYTEEGEEEEDDEDDEELDDEDMLFDAQYPLDASGGSVAFEWTDEAEPPAVRQRPRGGFSPFPALSAGRDQVGVAALPASQRQIFGLLNLVQNSRMSILTDQQTAVPNVAYSSHRPRVPVARSAEDGMNPLLQRNRSIGHGRDGSNRPPATMGAWIQAVGGPPGPDLLDIGFATRSPAGDGPAAAQFLDDVIRSLPLPGHLSRNNQLYHLHFTASGPGGRHLPPDLEALFGSRSARFESRVHNVEPGSVTFFTPQSTPARWLEETKLIFGATCPDQAVRLSGIILSLLVPPAIEREKALKAAHLEKARQEQEKADQKAEEERLAKEAREAEEKLARDRKEAEEREAAERAAAEALAARGPDVDVDNQNAGSTGSAPETMEGVETEGPATTADTPAEDRPRITTVIRGNTVDITDLGLDADFLAELPEDIREEVIMNAVAERRSHAASTGAQPSEIDQEFLNALPDDIRDEIIQQERQDRRRREREERNRQVAGANGAAPVGEMDAATILATLDPAFRNQVLMEQDDETLALLPPEMANQARAALRDHPMNDRIPNGLLRRATSGFPHTNESREINAQRPARRPIVQILDKPGVATLLRLMFIFQHGSLRSTLNSVLQNVSMNRHNRQEILSTILHILQDGTVDMPAVERSFAQLSLRAKQPKDVQPKTPQPLKRVVTGIGPLMQTNFEASPLMVVQQCLTTLVYLNQVNQHIPAFFLTEHETIASLKRSLSRKGKNKDSKACKYALNALLSLLDREAIMESSSVMESLSTLLNMITSPLQVLQRKQKEIEDAKTMESALSVSGTAGSATSPETITTNNEQSTAEPQVSQATSGSAAVFDLAPSGETSLSADTTVGKIEPPKEPEKKQRPITPPIIPDHNLKLVINIFVARECSSKTFRETLSTIKNLSAIPGAKAVFGRELVTKAQSMGEIILLDLEDLLPQIQKATTGTEIQGVALAKFSPGGSDQNKLLRVLTALDHLFDPKRERKDKPDEVDTEGESSQLVAKQDLLSTLYENSTFGRMWARLSVCLSAIRQREHMLNVATILLPLIEALMVVCKNTTLKDTPAFKSQIGKDVTLTSPAPESRMESLFFTFTEEHRKILNDLVRHTPKLMSGTFSLLVKNPKVLEFDNKRNYFSRSIHSKAPNSRQSFPPLQLSVRRDLVFHDSFKSLYFQSGDQMKYGKLSIRFHGEEGVDAGGVTREWFQVLSRQMFDPGYALFVPVSSDRTTFHPNSLSSVNEEHLMFFKFIGRIIGKALYEGRVLDCHFSRAVYKRILGKAVSVKDMESLDPDYYKSLIWMLENDITDIITETFSVDSDKFGVVETIDFIPNGRNIPVTEENKHEYVRLMVEWKLTGSVKEQLDEFLKGFHDIIPADLVAIFNEQELELLISGLPEIDVDDWKGNTEYHNYSASSAQIQWFWRAVRSYDKEERAKLLQFVTGTSKVPLNGFKELEGMNGFSRFNIHRDYGNKDRLPSSHTCFNQLDLPEYDSYETLRQQVLTAITQGSEYFGFA